MGFRFFRNSKMETWKTWLASVSCVCRSNEPPSKVGAYGVLKCDDGRFPESWKSVLERHLLVIGGPRRYQHDQQKLACHRRWKIMGPVNRHSWGSLILLMVGSVGFDLCPGTPNKNAESKRSDLHSSWARQGSDEWIKVIYPSLS